MAMAGVKYLQRIRRFRTPDLVHGDFSLLVVSGVLCHGFHGQKLPRTLVSGWPACRGTLWSVFSETIS
jgi:hypothetical protein